MVMFLLSFVKGVQIRGGESISASGFGPGGPILGGSKSAGTPAGEVQPSVSIFDRLLLLEFSIIVNKVIIIFSISGQYVYVNQSLSSQEYQFS